MKKILLWSFIILIAVSMVGVFSLAGCKAAEETAEEVEEAAEEVEEAAEEVEEAAEEVEEAAEEVELTKIRVAVMPFYLSAPINYINELGWDEEAGLDMEIISFANGAAMNEALGADLWDVAPTGGAAVFGVANFGAKFIADFIDGTGGTELYARPDHPVFDVKGYNPDFPDVYGDPDTVTGQTVMQTVGTTAQMAVENYLSVIGITNSDVNMVQMEFPQVYQGFLAGEGDICALVSPYVMMAQEQGWQKVAGLRELDQQLYETVICSTYAYENMKEELATFVNLIYKMHEKLEADQELKRQVVKDWYLENGTEVTDKDVQQECDLKPMLTKEDVKNIEYGKYEVEYSEFLASIDIFTDEQVEIVKDNTESDILDMVLAMD